jgi:hypothetical protein
MDSSAELDRQHENIQLNPNAADIKNQYRGELILSR